MFEFVPATTCPLGAEAAQARTSQVCLQKWSTSHCCFAARR